MRIPSQSQYLFTQQMPRAGAVAPAVTQQAPAATLDSFVAQRQPILDKYPGLTFIPPGKKGRGLVNGTIEAGQVDWANGVDLGNVRGKRVQIGADVLQNALQKMAATGKPVRVAKVKLSSTKSVTVKLLQDGSLQVKSQNKKKGLFSRIFDGAKKLLENWRPSNAPKQPGETEVKLPDFGLPIDLGKIRVPPELKLPGGIGLPGDTFELPGTVPNITG